MINHSKILDNKIVLTIILPFHHEGGNIAQTLLSLQDCMTVGHETLLIHDDKDDPTLSTIRSFQLNDPSIKVLMNKHQAGVPGAIKTGLEEALGKYILFLVADDPGPSNIISHMLVLMDQGYDLVSGSRYIKGGGISGGSFWARSISAWGNRLFIQLTSSKLSDPTCGIKMFRKDILQKINLKSKADWTIAFELAIETQYHHLKVTELPLRLYNRMDGGKSHFKILPRIFNYGQVFLSGIIKLWGKK